MAVRAAALLLGGALAVAPSPETGAQEPPSPALLSARLFADASGPDARVRVVYSLRVPAGVDRVPLTVLTPEPAHVEGLGFSTHPRLNAGELPPSPTAQRAGALVLRPHVVDEDIEVTLSYTVRNATVEDDDRLRVVIPVLAVDWPPAEALPGTFRARVQLPLDAVAYEAFPTPTGGLARAGTDPGSSELELSVLPAYVSLRATRGQAPLLSVPRATDTLLVLLLLGLGALGWSKLQRPKKESVA